MDFELCINIKLQGDEMEINYKHVDKFVINIIKTS